MEITYTIKNINAVAKQILRESPSKLLLFYGAMGVGKTTLIRELTKLLGVKDVVTSPTYSIVNQYQNQESQTINHLDCYRIKSVQEALEIGIEEYFYNDTYTFIEWPQRVLPLIPARHTKLIITNNTNGSRKIQLMPMQ